MVTAGYAQAVAVVVRDPSKPATLGDGVSPTLLRVPSLAPAVTRTLPRECRLLHVFRALRTQRGNVAERGQQNTFEQRFRRTARSQASMCAEFRAGKSSSGDLPVRWRYNESGHKSISS